MHLHFALYVALLLFSTKNSTEETRDMSQVSLQSLDKILNSQIRYYFVKIASYQPGVFTVYLCCLFFYPGFLKTHRLLSVFSGISSFGQLLKYCLCCVV